MIRLRQSYLRTRARLEGRTYGAGDAHVQPSSRPACGISHRTHHRRSQRRLSFQTPLRGQRNCADASPSQAKPPEHREVGVKRDALQTTHWERGESIVVLQPPELALHRSATAVEVAEPMRVARDAREQPSANADGQHAAETVAFRGKQNDV